MKYEIDSKERIARSNVYTLFGKLLRGCISNNEDGKVLLSTVGLSAYLDDYSNYLSPYRYNRGYRNDNESYNPEYACLMICREIEDSPKVLLFLFNSILSRQYVIKNDIFQPLSNYLDILGYELDAKKKDNEYYKEFIYTIVPATGGVQERDNDMSYLHSMLTKHHVDLVTIYDEAISNFGNAEYVSCIENCRTLFENFFKKLDADGDYSKGILSATGEAIIDNGASLTSQKKIFEYWIKNKSGANRFRLFQTEYSVMSGLGTHTEDAASSEDALLLLRFTEDTLLWCFRRGINC